MNLKTRRLRGEIMFTILDLPFLAPTANTHKVTTSDGTIYQSFSVDLSDKSGRITSSIPQNSSTIFLNISNCPLSLLIGLMAQLTESESDGMKFGPGKFMPMLDKAFLGLGVFGILFVPTVVAGILTDLEVILNKDGQSYCFLLFVFLSKEECNFIKEFGYEALLDKFEESNRDLMIHDFRSCPQ